MFPEVPQSSLQKIVEKNPPKGKKTQLKFKVFLFHLKFEVQFQGMSCKFGGFSLRLLLHFLAQILNLQHFFQRRATGVHVFSESFCLPSKKQKARSSFERITIQWRSNNHNHLPNLNCLAILSYFYNIPPPFYGGSIHPEKKNGKKKTQVKEVILLRWDFIVWNCWYSPEV